MSRSPITRCAMLALALALPGLARAQSRPREPGPSAVKPAPRKATRGKPRVMRTRPRPSQRIRFDDDVVTAGRGSGAGELVTGERRSKFSKLIRVRGNWLDMLIKEAEDV